MRWLGPLGLALVIGCGPNQSPRIQPMEDRIAAVGVELSLEVRASDPDGDAIAFGFRAPELPDLKMRPVPATISSFADGVAIFRWTPQGQDASPDPYAFDFTASDGRTVTVETVQITVRESGSSGSPIFRQPLGSGTTLDLDQDACVNVQILVDDSDSTEVTIAEQEPRIAGATLIQDGPFSATWDWCPTSEQIDAQDFYQLHLSADDGANPKVEKPYLILLKRTPKGNCPGAPPVVSHTVPGPQATVQDLKLTITVTDDLGLKNAPILYYSTTAPASPPDVTKMSPLQATRISGSPTDGVYEVSVPNPVASAAPGTKQTLYYLFSVKDNDDVSGSCDHTTLDPAAGAHSVEVTNPGGSTPGLPPCDPCTSDVQCGLLTDLCIPIGTGGGTYCARACGGSAPACPSGYSCSASTVTSVDGATARQCRPDTSSCGPAPVVCTDDRLEDNDGRTTIVNSVSKDLPPQLYTNLNFCPSSTAGGADEDWYGISVPTESTITAKIDLLTGMGYADLDLQLVDSTGAILERSYSTSAVEQVSRCVLPAAGKVYLRVFTFDSSVQPNLYDLTVTRTPGACSCTDSQEPDDSAAQAKFLGAPIFPTVGTFSGLQICSNNDDWFREYLYDGEQIVLDLLFTQSAFNEDLDLHFWKTDVTAPMGITDLTPCPPCGAANGQSASSNEHYEYTVPIGQEGWYYVQVKGWNGSTNTYELQATIHP